MAVVYSGGIVIGTSFKLKDGQPLDSSYVVEFVSDLEELDYLYEGKFTYVIETQTNWIKTAAGWKETSKTTILKISQDTIITEAHKSSMIIIEEDVLITVSQGLSPSFITDIDAGSPFRLQVSQGVIASGNIDGAIMPYNVPKNGQISIFSDGLNSVRIKGDVL